MKLINQSVEYIPQEEGLEGIYKQIENAARVCYKSENKSTGDSKSFVDKLIKMKHFSVLEHGTVYLYIALHNGVENPLDKYTINPYSKVATRYDCIDDEIHTYVSSNYRVLIENNWLDDLKYLCKPTEFHPKRLTFKLTTSISIVRELIRHRAFSFANESTRYVNLNKKGEFYFIKPYWYDECGFALQNIFDRNCKEAIVDYNIILQHKYPPQAAREVLPLCTKSELIMTGFKDDWDRFLELRLEGVTGKPHPDMLQLAGMIKSSLH